MSHPLRSSHSPAEDEAHQGAVAALGGVPVDLNAGMIQAVTNPPQGFVSKLSFNEGDLASRVRAIPWFACCGQPPISD